MSWNLSQIAEFVAGTLSGSKEIIITACVPLGKDHPQGIAFIEDERGLKKLGNVAAVFVSQNLDIKIETSVIRVENPRLAFFKMLKQFERPLDIKKGVHDTAIVDPSAKVHPGAYIGAYVCIGPDVQIEEGCRIYPHCFIGDRSYLESGVILYPHVTLYSDIYLGRDTIIHSGTVLGADGFGYHWNGKEHSKIPQIGEVHLGCNVEIGANSCIDKATCGATSIGDGTKIDNLVQVGHNVQLGPFNILAGQAGIAGSCTTGPGVIMGAQVGVKDHIHLHGGVRLGARTGVIGDLKPGDYFGMPALPLRESLRVMALQNRLPEIFDRLKNLEKQVEKKDESI